jgi:hypothetical protein
MGTSIYGRQDELVFELSIADRLRNGRAPSTLRVKLEDIARTRAADPDHLVSWEGERVLRIGRPKDGRKVVVLELTGERTGYDRIIAVADDADDAVAGLHRSGIGCGVVPAAA